LNQEMFIKELENHHITLTQHQINQFDAYYQMLVEWNQKMNLTTITSKEDVYLKHFYDSITMAFYHQLDNQSICDIGAGAGFPSIPLKIIFPNLKITIVDSLNKRISFLNHLTKHLELTNVTAISKRSEEYALTHRESFDIVSARAVARLNILNELCLPLVKEKGYFIALKGYQGLEEIKEATKGITTLGGTITQIKEFNLPNSGDHRVNIYIQKIKKTPNKYPRVFGKIKKQPL
jgi:16S rRNA (guanine(527)-N(7))-methyltransferase GidB